MKLEPASPSASSSDEIFLLDGYDILWPGDGGVEVIESDQSSLQGHMSPEPDLVSPDEEFHLPYELVKEEPDDYDSTVASPRDRHEMMCKMMEDLDSWIKEGN